MEINYSVEFFDANGSRKITGSTVLRPGENHERILLPAGTLRAIRAELSLHIAAEEKIFMNGYQSWTHCPEYDAASRICGLHGVHDEVIREYSLDRYGDYNFTDYPNRSGLTHGVSYCYFRHGENYRLFASLDETPGYTQFQYDANAQKLRIARDCAGICCGGEYHAFDLFFAQGSENAVFDAWFRVLNIQPRTLKKMCGYSSWYNRYDKIDQASLVSDLAGCKTLFQPGDLFQIDDGWEQAVGDWDEDTQKFPGGMKAIADKVHAAGFMAGLWLAPFGCQKSSRLFREHPEWVILKDGKPYLSGSNWGGFYSLDIDNSDAMQYLECVFNRVLNDWGFDFVKLDFLYGAAPFGSKNESRAARMRRAMECLRKMCGEKLILGCGVPLMPAFGLIDYCRIGCDVSLDWDNKSQSSWMYRERVSTRQAIDNTIFRRQLNGRAFYSDPDVYFLRTENCELTDEQKNALSVVGGLFSGLLLTSDAISSYTPEMRVRYQQIMHLRKAKNVSVTNENGICVHYTLDGRENCLKIPE